MKDICRESGVSFAVARMDMFVGIITMVFSYLCRKLEKVRTGYGGIAS